jgi:hypothetical protein
VTNARLPHGSGPSTGSGPSRATSRDGAVSPAFAVETPGDHRRTS